MPNTRGDHLFMVSTFHSFPEAEKYSDIIISVFVFSNILSMMVYESVRSATATTESFNEDMGPEDDQGIVKTN